MNRSWNHWSARPLVPRMAMSLLFIVVMLSWDGSSTVLAANAPPSNLIASLETPTHVRLNWFDNATDEGGYVVERCTGGGCSLWLGIASLVAGSTTHLDEVQYNTTYAYRVGAYGGVGPTAYSNVVTITTPPPPPPPAAPSGLKAVLGVNIGPYIDLTWQDNAYNETRFELERSNGPSYDRVKTFGARSGTGGRMSYRDTEMAAGRAYVYRVRAVNEGGASAWVFSNLVDVQVKAPSSFKVTLQDNPWDPTMALAWQDNASFETGFEIERSEGGGAFGWIATADPVSGTGGKGVFNDRTIRAGITYTYRVRAVYQTAGSARVSGGPVAVPTIPATPIFLKVITLEIFGRPNTVVLTMRDGSDNETRFEVQHATDSAFTSGVVSYLREPIVDCRSCERTWQEVLPSGSYYYRIRAGNPGGWSHWELADPFPLVVK